MWGQAMGLMADTVGLVLMVIGVLGFFPTLILGVPVFFVIERLEQVAIRVGRA